MSKNIKDWEAIFAQYKGSNLSKKDFCKEEGLSWNQFRYRWDRKNLLKTVQAKSLFVERPSTKGFFRSRIHYIFKRTQRVDKY
jgi:hypothetical protein